MIKNTTNRIQKIENQENCLQKQIQNSKYDVCHHNLSDKREVRGSFRRFFDKNIWVNLIRIHMPGNPKVDKFKMEPRFLTLRMSMEVIVSWFISPVYGIQPGYKGDIWGYNPVTKYHGHPRLLHFPFEMRWVIWISSWWLDNSPNWKKHLWHSIILVGW